MKVVFVGATKGMGRSLSRLMAQRGDELFLLGRDIEALEAAKQDLGVRGARAVHTGTLDLAEPSTFESAVDAAWGAFSKVDCVVITAAMFATQDALEADPELARKLCTVNFANTVAFCELVRPKLLAAGGGTLAVFSSVAGDRGRKPVAIYGASKAGLSHYLESLDHKFRASGLVTLCVKPGFVKTSMTEGLDPPPFAGESDDVAASVLAAIDGKKALVYAPWIWRYVMLVIKHVPRFVMRKVGF